MSIESPAPPSRPSPPANDPDRLTANLRIFVFVAIFLLLLAGALWLIMREEKRRGLLFQPEKPAAPAAEIPLPAPKPEPAPAPPRVSVPPVPPPSPALQQAAQMEEALTAYREAAAHLVARRFEQAEDRALAALRAYPQMAGAQRILGVLYLQQGRMDRAIEVLEAALRNEPFHPEALTHLAFAYLQANNPGYAMELIETCRRLHPDYKPALIQQGLMLLTQPDSQEAIDVLREAIAAFPNMPGPRNNLAVALARRGDREGAREQLTELLEISPNNFSALFNMGALAAQETNAPAAIPWLRRAMAQMPPANFRQYLNDPDLAPIRDTIEFQQLLQEIDPVFPSPPPAP
ncbi:MAG TPA: tetratricopeptide repeat protein [Kiritimatiellia bacterium]|jgi:tetratricopeptide (TPR) repeat protein|nr:tetratricopeptide repeat protein [Lentisphaerota bacterium]HOU21846.1 tetratricopeptide repeat protein [Kiritimatiellia bacterium]HPC19234.1 tetratricopeptide repeat protein [Kiritimatiellia bacterium]HQN81010.1 tetratricopeptide repeat protein [Kiritimatiellia bacterium]